MGSKRGFKKQAPTISSCGRIQRFHLRYRNYVLAAIGESGQLKTFWGPRQALFMHRLGAEHYEDSRFILKKVDAVEKWRGATAPQETKELIELNFHP